MRPRRIAWLVAVAAFAGGAKPAPVPSPIRIWTARALATVLAEVGPEFERTTGHRLQITSDLPAGFARRAAAGERFDLLISTSAVVNEWIHAGRIVADTRTDLASSGIGVAVRANSPKPDITTVEAFLRTLLEARSVAYLRVGSGLHLDALLERFGMADAMRPKAVRPDTDIVCELVARGEVDLGVVVTTQILTTPGVDLVGPLPSEIQSRIMFTAGVSATATAPDAAMQLVRFLREPRASHVMTTQGMERAP